MRLDLFERMVREMAGEVPPAYFDGVTEVVVSPRAVAHPDRDGVFTLGECIPLALDGEGADAVQSRVVLYHGSFAALAEGEPEFDWEGEAWETLTHELRHHVEWRARESGLEHYDDAVDANHARHDGTLFDPLFFHDGTRLADGWYQVEDDIFLDVVVAGGADPVEFTWKGDRYTAPVPPGVTYPAYLEVEGVRNPPPGELVMVLRRKASFRDLFRRHALCEGTIRAHLAAIPTE